jgi:hypothetical protein
MLKRILFGVIALLLLATNQALAKGPPDKVTISGPGLDDTIEITDPASLAHLELGALENLGRGAIPKPAGVSFDGGYVLTRSLKKEQ